MCVAPAPFFRCVFRVPFLKYCFSGDQKLQDQSAIAQDIATLYAAIPDHTATRGVSEKGRAQFTDFKYEKSEVRSRFLLSIHAESPDPILSLALMTCTV